MASTELRELETYWLEKYPQIAVTLWEREADPKYFGKMRTQNSCQDLSARTIGELINQGENFLRKIKL